VANDTVFTISIDSDSSKARKDVQTLFDDLLKVGSASVEKLSTSFEGFAESASAAVDDVSEKFKGLSNSVSQFEDDSARSVGSFTNQVGLAAVAVLALQSSISSLGSRAKSVFSDELESALQQTNDPLEATSLAIDRTLGVYRDTIIEISRTIRRVITGDSRFLIDQFTKVRDFVSGIGREVKSAIAIDILSERLSSLVGPAAVSGIALLAFNFDKVSAALGRAAASAQTFIKDSNFAQSFAGQKLNTFSGGLLSLSERLIVAGAGSLVLARALQQLDNEAARVAGSLLQVLSKVAIGLSLGISFVVIKAAELSLTLANNLVGALQSSFQSFLKTDQSAKTFAATVSTFNNGIGQSVGSLEEWSETIARVGETFNFTTESLEGAARELIFVGSQIGLNKVQLQGLLKVSAEYAKINGKEVFDTTVALAQALNGNSASAINLGVKLTEASVQQFALKNGIDSSISSLSENEKVQLRFNTLLSQYSKIAGIGVASANTLAQSQERLEVTLANVNASFGKGVAIVENFQIVNAALNKVLKSLSSEFLTVSGFVSAIGARLLQASAIAFVFATKIFALVAALRGLDVLLSSAGAAGLFDARIRGINLSINDLLSKILGGKVALTGFSLTTKGTGAAIQSLIDTFTRLTFGVKLADATFLSLARGGIARLALSLKVVGAGLLTILAPLAPFLVKFAAIGAVIFVVSKAFIEVEKRTQAFSQIFNIFTGILAKASPLVDGIRSAFVSFTNFIVTKASQGFGLVVAAISQITAQTLKLAKTFPFKKFFSASALADLDGVSRSLNALTQDLVASGFDIRELATRNLASLADDTKKIIDVNIEALRNIQSEADDFLSGGLASLQKTYDQRINIITNALAAELITEEEFSRLKLFADRSFQEERNKILDELKEKALVSNQELTLSFSDLVTAIEEQAARLKITFGEVAKAALSSFANGVGNAFASVGRALVQGKNAFEAFGKAFIGILGGLAIQLGQFFIAKGIALSLDPTTPGSGAGLIGAGIGLTVLGGVLQALGDGGASFSGGGFGGAGGGGTGDITGGAGPGQVPDLDRNRGTEVAINIQGNVLDRRETGLEIATVLQEFFDTNDGVLARA
jgi:hypothetical protein